MKYVCIVEDATNVPNKVMGPMDERSAERVADGASINLDWEHWHIAVLDESEISEEWKALVS